MYYKEQFIEGVLMFRVIPDGRWKKMNTSWGKAANVLFDLTDDERMKVFDLFCIECGDKDPSCCCWNDR